MDERKKYYEDMDKEANQKIQDAEVAKNEYENRLSLLDDDIAQKKSEALAEAQEKRDQIIDKARAEAEEIIESAKKVSAFERERNIARAKEEIEAYVTKAAKEIVMSGDPYENFANAAKKESNDD
jgi:F0F1-type ATP synthase membrane subunit b/b'